MCIYANSFDMKNLDKFIGEDPGFFCSSLMVIFFVFTVLMWRMEPGAGEAWREPVRPAGCCYRTLPSAGTPSCTARTATTTCHPSLCPAIPPYRVMCKYSYHYIDLH